MYGLWFELVEGFVVSLVAEDPAGRGWVLFMSKSLIGIAPFTERAVGIGQLYDLGVPSIGSDP